MADINAQVDLNALHDAIISQIKAAFPMFVVVDDYPLDKKPKAVPACYISLEEFEPADDEDAGTGQQSLNLRFAARIVIGFRTATAGRQVRLLATALTTLIHENRWGQPINAASVLGGYEDAFDADLDQFLVWRVEWHQVGQFGNSVWDETAPMPDILIGIAPDIGFGHEADYQPIGQAFEA